LFSLVDRVRWNQLIDIERRLSTNEFERDELRRQLQHVQDENERMKSYIDRLPSDIEYQRVRQSHRILEEQLKQSNEMIADYRNEKNILKTKLTSSQQIIDEQRQRRATSNDCAPSDAIMFNAKCFTVDERIAAEQQCEHLRRTIDELTRKLTEEKSQRKQQEYLQDNNRCTVQSLSNDIAERQRTIKEMTSLLRQVWTRLTVEHDF
jgi:chromosome segregation ATPase